MELAAEIATGNTFLKYGRKGEISDLIMLIPLGNPHKRFVWISEEDNKIYWRDQNKYRKKSRSISFDEVYKKCLMIIMNLIDK